jgi:hypothetical protein
MTTPTLIPNRRKLELDKKLKQIEIDEVKLKTLVKLDKKEIEFMNRSYQFSRQKIVV